MPGYFAELEDEAAVRFYQELASERLVTTRCAACAHTFFPPQSVCPRCLGSDLSWVELPGTGRLYAFTQQHYAIVHTKPEVVGAVEVDGCSGRAFALIHGRLEELKIGMPLEVEYVDSPFGMKLLGFKPA
jgi:uncharacterized OB-fold protein